jgi:hypothetical protein
MTSYPYDISIKMYWLLKINPKSILDIGCGFGSFGVLCREYTDVVQGRIRRDTYKTYIEAVEIDPNYIILLKFIIYIII